MKKIRTMYWNNNLGDALNMDLCKALFQKEILFAYPKSCEAVMTGSLLECFLLSGAGKSHLKSVLKLLPKVKVWGTGFMAEPGALIKRGDNRELLFRNMDICALRGNKSKYRMEIILNRKLDNTVIGDPGLLAGELINKAIIHKKYKYGIIPHYADKKSKVLNNIHVTNSLVIDVQEDPIECIKKIARCELIISSSLHGLIVADSLNIPNIRMQCSDNITGGDYKFNDYYSGFGIENPGKMDIRGQIAEEKDIWRIAEAGKIHNGLVEAKKNDLYRVFPYQ